MKSFNTFNIVRVIVGTFIIGWWLLIMRNYSESMAIKYCDWSMWIENMLIASVISFVIIVILKIKKIKVF